MMDKINRVKTVIIQKLQNIVDKIIKIKKNSSQLRIKRIKNRGRIIQNGMI